MAKLTKEQRMTIPVLKHAGQSPATIARTLDVDESTVRYHLKRHAAQATDGRGDKPSLVQRSGLADVVAAWWGEELKQLPAGRSPNATALHDWLVLEHDFDGSVQSVRRHVARHCERPAQRPFRRVELPPAAQVQVDWSEHRDVDLGAGVLVTLYILHLTLAHSRRQVDIACRSCDQLAWHDAHVAALERLGGVPATARIDNLKTGMSHGSGVWGTVNPQYEVFARELGFHVDPCPVRTPRAKGKVERGVRTMRGADLRRVAPLGLEALQGWLDQQSEARDRRRVCPVTGLSVWESWQAEQALLRPLPSPLPVLFDTLVHRRVQRDCLVNFEGRQYSVPYVHAGADLEVRGTATTVDIHDPATGTRVARWPRHSQERLLIDPDHFEDRGDAVVPAPLPLGALGARLVELGADPIEHRSIDLYAQVADVIEAREQRRLAVSA